MNGGKAQFAAARNVGTRTNRRPRAMSAADKIAGRATAGEAIGADRRTIGP